MRRNDDRDQDTAGADERPSPLACLHRALRRRPHWRHPHGAPRPLRAAPGTPPQGPRLSSLTPVRPHAAARDVAAGEPHGHSQCNRLPLSGASQGPLLSRAPHSLTLPGHCPEKDQGQPGLALPCPLLQCDLGCQSSSAKRAGVPSGAPAVCVGGWGRGQDRGGPPQHRAELAATTGTPRAAKLRQTNQRSFHSASYVHRFL